MTENVQQGFESELLGKRENRVKYLKQGFIEGQLAMLFIRFMGYKVVNNVLFTNQ